ncbi:nucleosome assembly protein 1;4, partial [Tanacetum coccineum]
NEYDELEAEFFEERAALEAKNQKLYAPLYSKYAGFWIALLSRLLPMPPHHRKKRKLEYYYNQSMYTLFCHAPSSLLLLECPTNIYCRYDIVTGAVEVDGAKEEDAIAKGVPEFWLTAMKNNEITAEEITERDEKALKHLKDIKWCRMDDPKGFKLEFFFDTNPLFTNSVLTKGAHVILTLCMTTIEWLPGKCLTQKILKKKPKKGSKNPKHITKTEDCESFLNFFSPPEVPDDAEEIEEDEAEELQNQMEQDYDVGSTIRDKIIPHAVSWFTGEANEEDFGVFDDEDDEVNEDDEDDDEIEEDEDDEDEDEEEDDEETKTKTKKKPSGSKKGGKSVAGGEAERPPECKQQYVGYAFVNFTSSQASWKFHVRDTEHKMKKHREVPKISCGWLYKLDNSSKAAWKFPFRDTKHKMKKNS